MLGQVSTVDSYISGVGLALRAAGHVILQHQPGGYNTVAAILSVIGVSNGSRRSATTGGAEV